MWNTVRDQIRRGVVLGDPGFGKTMRKDLIEDLCATGILVMAGPDDPSTPLMFTLSSYGEYLAGCALANRLCEEDPEEDWIWVERKAWDPDWGPVLVFTAGRLGQKAAGGKTAALDELMKRLLGVPDDRFRHRLALAAVCLAEAPAKPASGAGRGWIESLERCSICAGNNR
jgi:hypothetical protein